MKKEELKKDVAAEIVETFSKFMESYDVDALLIVHHNDELGTVFKGEHLDLATSLFCLARENEDFANMFRLANKALKNDGTESVRQ